MVEKLKGNEFTLANKITVLRIILTPVTVISLINGAHWWFYGLFSFCALTDLLDGLAARLRGEQTQIGAFLDPIADKFFLISVYLSLTFIKAIDVWLFVVVFSRDLLIILGWCVIYILTRSRSVSPRPIGKLTTFVQIISALLFTVPGLNPLVRHSCVWLIVAITVASIVDYLIVGEKRLVSWES